MRDFLSESFAKMTEGQPVFSRRIAINLADMCGMEVRTMVRALEKRNLLKHGSWDWFVSNGGFTKQHYIQARSDARTPPHNLIERKEEV